MIKAAERDLSTVAATLRLFELGDQAEQFPACADISRFWKRGEIVKVFRAALEAEGPLDAREFALRVLRAKGLDEGDAVLRKVGRISDCAGNGDRGEARTCRHLGETKGRSGMESL